MSSLSAGIFRGCRSVLAPASRTFSSAAASRGGSSTGARKSASKPKPKPRSSSPATARSTGIFKVSPVSPALAQFLGAGEASRTDAIKGIWAYIKSHDLQNPADKREVICDEKLKHLFEGKDRVGFLEIGKLLSPHFVKTS
ncbi:PREDICTED: protein TRI1 [Tarenaya hassleriana]|uniref:protein TRI1 n=1 Tax=Tarenaya hassleriana TaxID=28532 RepID=UPI00053C27CE|nr:PREDICTED: protein TRI1 [Tarenaya hassleriana]